MSLTFEWNEAKNRINVAKHGIDFQDVRTMFELPMLMKLDDSDAHDEERWKAVGWLGTILCLVVFIQLTEDRVRIISARKATKQEAILYGQVIKH
jgi:uncharacterized DUF497 family protein